MNDHAYDVLDNKEARRYELMIDGTLAGYLEYQLVDGTMVLPYVEIDPAFGGRGNGGRLTAAVLDDCRARGLKVVPECPFIKAFLRDHPEYADLRAG